MKNIHAIILATSLLFVGPSGCALLSRDSTTEAKLADVKLLCYAAASIGTAEAIRQNGDWRMQFVSASEQLDRLLTQKVITGDLLRAVIASLPVKELKSDSARIAIETASVVYDMSVGTRANIEKEPYLYAAATGLRDGMKIALGL